MTAIFDIGKTNKKCLVFDADYRVVYEKSTTLAETVDEDGFPCEDLGQLTDWLLHAARDLLAEPGLDVTAFNVAAYGASLVYVDTDGRPLTPLYNYLKPFPAELERRLFDAYGGATALGAATASPALGSLNSGLQLLRLKYEQPAVFARVRYALHLPQYLASLLTGEYYSEITSIGCHTMLWDFQRNDYHAWVHAEGLADKFPPLRWSDTTLPVCAAVAADHSPILRCGIGLHDSSAALLPYRTEFQEPFVLLSTGTWCIALNPFNDEPLTAEELAQDCLCYLGPDGRPVKAARYFGGHEHDEAVRDIARQHGVAEDFHRAPGISTADTAPAAAYRAFMRRLMEKQARSLRLALGRTGVRRIFVDGGFAHNPLYRQLLAEAFPDLEICAAEVAQATALGAALALRGSLDRMDRIL